jgi:hypothetical protein
VSDHERGCSGREYTCTCGHDDTITDTIEAQAAEIKRLREALAHLANTIDIVGSHYHRAQVAIDDLVLDVKKSARAALRETK